MTQKTIMLVDDNIANLKIGRNALSDKYNVFTIPSGEKLFQMMEKALPDLILLDVEMPEMDGYDVIKRLKRDERTASIPVVFLTAKSDPESELEGLSLGAVDYIVKPFSPPILLKRVETHLLLKDYNDDLLGMVAEKTKTVTELQNTLLTTVATIVEYRDDITGHHVERTGRYLSIIVEEVIRSGLYRSITENWDVNFLYQSASLHDVGKIAIRDSILMKPGRLDVKEFEIMKEHTTYGVRLIEKIEQSTTERNFLHHAKIFAGTHHERWDGLGYPNHLRGEEIPLQGRLMAIVDVYDALISERPYKKSFTHELAVDIIKSESGSHFDPALVDIFLTKADEFNRVAGLFKGH
ncbi:two-component system response regulator [Deltaproteobacteria bacterium Smac51]|nr:two-component system response regulator [Deltaproteobacteria bacterium Smac51]